MFSYDSKAVASCVVRASRTRCPSSDAWTTPAWAARTPPWLRSKIGTGTPGYDFASENLKGAKYPAGTVAMANEGSATTNGSQFFIVFKDSTSGLTASYTPFATVSSGLGIVQNVAKDGYSCQYAQSGGGAPKKKVIIDSVTIKKT